MNMPSAQQIAERYSKYAPQRADRFEEGVRSPKKDWKTNTKAAESNYEEGVRAGISRKAFGKGVEKCGTARQQERTIKKINRWPEGIVDAQDDMAKAMEPVVAVMSAVKLPPRYAKGDPRNYERVKAIGTALRKAKEAGQF